MAPSADLQIPCSLCYHEGQSNLISCHPTVNSDDMMLEY